MPTLTRALVSAQRTVWAKRQSTSPPVTDYDVSADVRNRVGAGGLQVGLWGSSHQMEDSEERYRDGSDIGRRKSSYYLVHGF
jgi:hypothetical protein